MNRKLVFFDIDGTLISHVGKSHVPEATVRAVARLKENGHVAAIATARNLCMTRKTADFFGIELAVCCNGAHVTRLEPKSAARESLSEAWLSPAFTEAFKNAVPDSLENASALDANHVYSSRVSDAFGAYVLEQAGDDCLKPLPDLKRAYLAYTFVPTTPLWSRNREFDVEIFETPYYVEFRPLGVSKWSGILKAAESLGFDCGDIVAIGDGHNDIEMVENAAVGIAVGGAEKELKAVADIVAEDIDEGGILSALRRLGVI